MRCSRNIFEYRKEIDKLLSENELLKLKMIFDKRIPHDYRKIWNKECRDITSQLIYLKKEESKKL